MIQEVIENQNAKIEYDSEEVRIFVNEENELSIRDILAIHNISWNYDDTVEEAVICIDKNLWKRGSEKI